VDILSDILVTCGLRRRLLNLHSLAAGMAMRFPCERSIGLHAVTRGRAYVLAPTLPAPLELHAGDVAVMARGCVHLLALQADAPDVQIPVQPAQFAATCGDALAPPGENQIISGAYQLWNAPLHPFLREMPPWFVLRADTVAQLSALPLTLGLLDTEVREHGLGATTITHGLLDAVFTYALRAITERHGTDGTGWNAAVRDSQIRHVLALMHGEPGFAWTLEELAQRAGLSRTSLAERFRTALGDTPLNHLRTLRMQKAMQLLSETRQTLEQVAQAVGYQDAFGFSKVFKRTTGMAPRAFREQDARDRQQPWRLQEA
jgi:AraC-like DNA-binding protein